MGIPDGCGGATAIIPIEEVQRLRALAVESKVSISKMLAQWIIAGAEAPLICQEKLQTVRAVKDELMVSLPMDFVHRCDIHKKDVAKLSYSENTVLITFKKV